MTTQAKFHITTTNGRQRALWLRLFGSDVLPVTAAAPHEVYTPDGRARLVYDLDVVAIGTNGRRRLAAYIAARRWGTTFEAALRDVAFGWTVDATDCELVAEPVTEPVQNSRVETRSAISRPTVPPNGRTPRPRRKSRERRAYGRSLSGAIGHQPGLSLP
ncbi:MAG: hypothetical protein IT327_07755 [Anaerolineae bacterium]|nr:hypothetical protein [Anaerolineae bacterium]